MELNDILFSVNTYDRDGDLTDEGIFLHFGNTTVKVAETKEDFEKVTKRISGMVEELKENY